MEILKNLVQGLGADRRLVLEPEHGAGEAAGDVDEGAEHHLVPLSAVFPFL